MNCSKPFIKDGGAFGCGQCIACRINKRREWKHRLILEAYQHEENAFITLTFDEDNYPEHHSVERRTAQLFLKRLRKAYGGRIRYFLVGEYGDETGRPHYHAALFGYSRCENGSTRYDRSGNVKCCPNCHRVSDAWGYGRIQVAELEPQSMGYICGYVTKKMTKDDDPRLEGRLPEFATMSLRPGIGYDAMHDLADVLMKFDLDLYDDVPLELQHGKEKLPLGQYLRRNLRLMVGKDASTPDSTLEKYKEKLRPLRESAFNNSRSFKEEVLAASLGRRIQLEAKQKRNKDRKTL